MLTPCPLYQEFWYTHSLGIADWTRDEHMAQRQSAVALAVVQRDATGLPGETFQNIRCPIQYQMEILSYSISAGPLEVYFEKAVQLLLMGSPGKEPLSAGFKAVFPQRGSLYCVVIRQTPPFWRSLTSELTEGWWCWGIQNRGTGEPGDLFHWHGRALEQRGKAAWSEQKWADRCCVLRGAIRL